MSHGRAAVVTLTASGRRQADKLERQEEWFAGEILERIDRKHRAAVVERLADLLVAVRAATTSCCPEGAFDHLMTGFPPGDARLGEAGIQTRSCDDCECR